MNPRPLAPKAVKRGPPGSMTCRFVFGDGALRVPQSGAVAVTEVVPELVEFEVAVPHLSPAVR